MHCGKKWWIREFVTPSIFPLNPDYVAARSLRSLRSNYWIVYGEQSQNLIVTIVYFKYFQVHNTLSFRKSPVLQSAFSRHTYWLFVLFFSILFFQYQGYFVSTLSSLFLFWTGPWKAWSFRQCSFEPCSQQFWKEKKSRLFCSLSLFALPKLQRLLLPWRLLWKCRGLSSKRRSTTL